MIDRILVILFISMIAIQQLKAQHTSVVCTPLMNIKSYSKTTTTNNSDGYLIQFTNEPQKAVQHQLRSMGLTLTKRIFNDPVIYLAHKTSTRSTLNISDVRRLNNVVYINKNRRAELRNTEPDDPLYRDMWHLEQIHASAAWDFATSGVTADGDSIVLGIYDSGYELDHPDLENNIWKNQLEIPNDNIDNDGNGYIDDYIGINFFSGKDDHRRASHGTEVAGVIAASGNNDIGGSGVTWNSKLLLMSKSVGGLFEADFIEGYNYIIAQRKLYNESDGENGAFIVAVNLSIGIPKAKAEDYPMWCGIYEEIGKYGILGICATDNDDYNVDIEGDMPTTCPSKFLIAVTASNKQDNLLPGSAYGPIHIDLAAPGEDILSTAVGRDYSINTGTSLATPQVTGAVALLYMAASEDLLNLINLNPSSGALVIRNMILDNVEQNNNLQPKVASGGRLDLIAAVNAARNYVDGPAPGALSITDIYPTLIRDGAEITVQLDIPTENPTNFSIIRIPSGRAVHRFLESVALPVGQHAYRIPTTQLAAGGYLLMVEHNGEEVTREFVVVGL